jgi:hypothetical protein
LYHEGKFKEAIPLLEDLSVPWTGFGPLLTTALAYIKLGEKEKAFRLKEELASAKDYFSVAVIDAACHDMEACFQNLQKEETWNYWAVISIHSFYPEILEPVRQHVYFEEIRNKVRKIWL